MYGMEEVRSSILLSSTENPRSQALQSMTPSSRPVQLTPCQNRFQPKTALFRPPGALEWCFLWPFTRLTSSTPAERLGTKSRC